MEYPECEKMQKVQNESQAIGQFLDWLEEDKGVSVDYQSKMTINELLADYFEIDLTKVEEEKRHMLATIRGELDE